MTRESRIEAVARAICNSHDIDPDMAIGINGSMPKWAIEDATAAISALEKLGAYVRNEVKTATDVLAFGAAIRDFETELPGFWWSVGQCSVGAHASCAVDGTGVQKHLLDGVDAGHPFDAGFHCDTQKGTPEEALRDVLLQARAMLAAKPKPQGKE